MDTAFGSKALTSRPLMGGFVSMNTSYAAQIMARCGFDWLMIDMEHSPLSALEATNMVHAALAASQGSCLPIVRIPAHGVEWIKWALDSGAPGIIIPMVNTKEEMDQIIKRAYYPPLGARSSGPFRTPFADLTERTISHDRYKSEAVKSVAVMPMIESAEGVANAEAIMSTKGVNGVFIGPVDLRASLGFSGADGDEPEYLEALKKVLSIANRLEIPVGILGSQTALKRQVDMGFRYFLLMGDADLIYKGAQLVLNAAHRSIQESSK